MAGAPRGNDNRNRGRVWRDALHRALEARSKSRADGIAELDALAGKLLDVAGNGDIQALRELGDRLEGKPPLAITGEDGGPVSVRVVATETDVEL